ncbi:VOC family protein [Chitinophaga ginsengisegetis]|uniref:VOC family protein n=1 Tax=Chitinophaga ginsengisegetis TaxID=393003 RepID=UPI000DB9F457|nr:VOC family protein [Chitinophaga ginsengisegetis]MDR6567469.1 catechol 2,3-dioxygenase-like lactoylglutathione lyase family enzyme [Chitinophaga ginsengisegetis]MDR6647200.1 catechol 2,3-dioxygenase-like lactoylglutathione lyase family enzyme [Chitinophaga ginsengisegetis]MDR6653549.1 catechol 2,3-dioxygenase-like lactoylglutathione lyase family enzyme [Chitinophaga ginsengisegetis]
MVINRLDHLVLTVKDISATCRFYETVLGMEVITFGDDRKALRFGHQKINLHEKGREIDPKALTPTMGSADLCFIADTAVEEILVELTALKINILEGGIVERTGATGKIRSIYFRDPDGNLLEVSNYISK